MANTFKFKSLQSKSIAGGVGTFTTLNANNGTLTASAPVLDLSQTWNNAATTFIGATINANVTAAATTSRVFRVQIDGTERFWVTRWGEVQASAGFSTGGNVQSTFGSISLSGQVLLYAGGSNIIEQRTTGAAAQEYRIYGQYTSASNFERLSLKYNSTALAFQIGTEKGTGSPSGTARPLEFQTDGVTRMRLTTDGTTQLTGSLQISNQTQYTLISAGAFGGLILSDGSNRVSLHYTGITIRNDAYYGWSSSTNSAVSPDTTIRRVSAGLLQINAEYATQYRDLVLRALMVGGTTASFPALRNSSTTLQVRLADDSAFAPFAAGLITATGNLVLTDNDGAQTATFDAQSKLTANRTYDLPDASGVIALTNQISKTYAVFTALDNQPPATAFATLDTRNSIAVLDFDAATDENAVFVGIMPEGASLGSGLIVRLHWMATSATSGNVRWGVQFERSNTDLDADSFDTAVEATAAANGTSGILTTTAITVTTIDGITAGDVFRLKVFRNADDATNDTMTGDAELVAVEVRSAA